MYNKAIKLIKIGSVMSSWLLEKLIVHGIKSNVFKFYS